MAPPGPLLPTTARLHFPAAMRAWQHSAHRATMLLSDCAHLICQASGAFKYYYLLYIRVLRRRCLPVVRCLGALLATVTERRPAAACMVHTQYTDVLQMPLLHAGNCRASARAPSYWAARSRAFDTADATNVRGLQIATRSWGVLDHPLGEDADAMLLDDDQGSEDEAVAAAAAAAATAAAAAVRSAGAKKQAAVTKATGVAALAPGGRWHPHRTTAASGGRSPPPPHDAGCKRHAVAPQSQAGRRAAPLQRACGGWRGPPARRGRCWGGGPHTARHLRGALQQSSQILQPGGMQRQWTLTPLLVPPLADAASCVHMLCAANAAVCFWSPYLICPVCSFLYMWLWMHVNRPQISLLWLNLK